MENAARAHNGPRRVTVAVSPILYYDVLYVLRKLVIVLFTFVSYWVVMINWSLLLLQRRLFHCATMSSEEHWVRICGEDHQHKEAVGKRSVHSCSLSA